MYRPFCGHKFSYVRGKGTGVQLVGHRRNLFFKKFLMEFSKNIYFTCCSALLITVQCKSFNLIFNYLGPLLRATEIYRTICLKIEWPQSISCFDLKALPFLHLLPLFSSRFRGVLLTCVATEHLKCRKSKLSCAVYIKYTPDFEDLVQKEECEISHW